MLKIELKSGEIVTGEPNYVTAKLAEIRLADGTYRALERSQIESATRPKRGDADA